MHIDALLLKELVAASDGGGLLFVLQAKGKGHQLTERNVEIGKEMKSPAPSLDLEAQAALSSPQQAFGKPARTNVAHRTSPLTSPQRA